MKIYKQLYKRFKRKHNNAKIILYMEKARKYIPKQTVCQRKDRRRGAVGSASDWLVPGTDSSVIYISKILLVSQSN